MIFHTNFVTGKYISFLVIRLNYFELLGDSLYPDFCDTRQIFPFSRCYKTQAFLNLLVARLYVRFETAKFWDMHSLFRLKFIEGLTEGNQ